MKCCYLRCGVTPLLSVAESNVKCNTIRVISGIWLTICLEFRASCNLFYLHCEMCNCVMEI